MVNVDALFAGMATAKINGSGTYMDDGLYVVELKQVIAKASDNPLKPGNNFICEFEILESSNPKHPVGSTGSWVLSLANPYAMGNISELVIAALGHENTKDNHANADIRGQVAIVTRAALGSDTAKAELAAFREALGPSYGQLVGTKLKLETAKKATKPSAAKPEGGVFTVHKWAPLKAAVAA